MVSLLLLVAQHGALLHELGHYAHGAQTAGTALQGSSTLDGGRCLTCEAFSQVTNPATAGAVHVPLSPAALTPIPDPSFGVAAANAPTPRSRGPPQV